MFSNGPLASADRLQFAKKKVVNQNFLLCNYRSTTGQLTSFLCLLSTEAPTIASPVAQEPTLTTTEPRVTTSESTLTTTEPRVTTSESTLTTLEQRVTTSESTLTTLEQKVTTSESTLTTTEPRGRTSESTRTTETGVAGESTLTTETVYCTENPLLFEFHVIITFYGFSVSNIPKLSVHLSSPFLQASDVTRICEFTSL